MRKGAHSPFPMYPNEALVRPEKNTRKRVRRPERGAQLANMSFFIMKYDQYFVWTRCLLLCKSVYAAAGWAIAPVPDLCHPTVSRRTETLYHICITIGEGFYFYFCRDQVAYSSRSLRESAKIAARTSASSSNPPNGTQSGTTSSGETR